MTASEGRSPEDPFELFVNAVDTGAGTGDHRACGSEASLPVPDREMNSAVRPQPVPLLRLQQKSRLLGQRPR